MFVIFWISVSFLQALLFSYSIFELLHNIVKLSDHMKQQDKPRLTPYTGKITSDETGDLAISFNQRFSILTSSRTVF